MANETEMRDLLGQELAAKAGPEVERWLQTAVATRGTEGGARLGARFTKVDHIDLELDLTEAPEAALRKAREILSREGDLRGPGEDGGPAPTVSAVVPSGFWNLNPALVTVAIAPREHGSRARVDAYALEGLIKQRAAPKAAARIAELLGAASR